MADRTQLFFQTLLNNPSVTPAQRKRILQLRRENRPGGLGKSANKSSQDDDLNNEDTFAQPVNVANLLSKFDKGNDYGVILNPDSHDDAAFAKTIAEVQHRLIADVTSTSIPKTLKALISVFVLGKYGTYTEWIGWEGRKYSLTCSSDIVKELCKDRHPIDVSETNHDFEQFGMAITVNGQVVNTLLDMFEKEYCKAVRYTDKALEMFDIEDINKTLEKPLDPSVPLSQQPIKRFLERSNLDNVYFHTNTNLFRCALAWLLTVVVRHTAMDGYIYVGFEDRERICSIVVRHSCVGGDTKNMIAELVEVRKRLVPILTGYAEVTAEGFFDKDMDGNAIGACRLYLIKESSKKSEMLDAVDSGITYRMNFHKSDK